MFKSLRNSSLWKTLGDISLVSWLIPIISTIIVLIVGFLNRLSLAVDMFIAAGVFAFVLVAVTHFPSAWNLVFSLKKRPHLKFLEMANFGMYHVLPNICGFGIKVANDQIRYESTAHNINASISFDHVLGDGFKVNSGVWYDQSGEFFSHISLGMGQEKWLLIYFWDTQKSSPDFRAVNKVPPVYADSPRLEYGEWIVQITLKSDNVEEKQKWKLILKPNDGVIWSSL